MIEATERNWRVGQEVNWPKVNPYTIVELVGFGKNIHISEQGRLHVFWHRENLDGRKTLVHHGGLDGFATLNDAKHQHERVILRYVGMAIDIPPEGQDQDTGPSVDATLSGLALQMESLEIPGEQQRVEEWLGILRRAVRDIPTFNKSSKLTLVKEDLANLIDPGNYRSLARSINRHKRAARDSIAVGLGDTGNLFGSVTEAQMQLLLRANQTVSITLGVMQRYNSLESLQIMYDQTIGTLPPMCARLVRAIDVASLNQDNRGDLEAVAKGVLINETSGLVARLRGFKVEPYFSKAQEFIGSITPLRNFWEQRDDQLLVRQLMEQLKRLELWRREVEEQKTGVNFGKYALS